MIVEQELSYRIRGCVYEVFRELGGGFLEKVYENALLHDLRSAEDMPAHDHVNLFAEPGKVKGFLAGGIPPADHGNILAFIEIRIAFHAIADTAA